MRSFIAGYTGDQNEQSEITLLKHLKSRYRETFAFNSRKVNFLTGDVSQNPKESIYSGLYVSEDNGLCFAGQFREAPLGTENGGMPYAEALYKGIVREGASFINKLRGSFVIAMFQDGQLKLIRDRAGRFNLYYTKINGQVYFSIEAKALVNLSSFRKELDPGSVARYFTYSFQPSVFTMYKGLKKMRPASMLTFDGVEEKNEYHYSYEDRAKSDWECTMEPDHWVKQFQETLSQAVSRCNPDGSQTGAFLSGGLDSSIIAAEVQSQRTSQLPTFALHFGKKYDNELDFASQVAKHIGSDHREIELQSKNMLEKLSDLVSILNDPIGDPVTLGNYEMSRYLGQNFQVMFNGEGGDPCFGGPKNFPMMLSHLYQQKEMSKNWQIQQYLRSYHRAYLEWPRLLQKNWLDKINVEQDLENPIEPYFSRDHHVLLRKMLELNQCEKGAQLILPKVDQLQGSAGIMAQSPLYDEDIIDLSMTLPTNMILHHGQEKYIMKQAYKNRIPDSVITRPKSGMRVPVYHWFNGPLKPFAKKILNKKRLRSVGLFDENRVHEILKMNTEESGSRYGIWLWMLVTFEIWRIQEFEGESL